MSMLDLCLFRGYGVSFVQFIDIKPSFPKFALSTVDDSKSTNKNKNKNAAFWTH